MDVIVFDWQTMLRELGPLMGVILFFIWRDWKREVRLSERVEKLEDYQRETLVHLVEKGTAALVQSCEVIKWIGRTLDRVSTKCPHMEASYQDLSDMTDITNG
jgi:hypothetical protein